MRAFTSLTAIVLTWAVCVPDVRAQDATAAAAPDATSLAIEVTPFVSLESRGTAPVGATITFPLNSRFSIETEAAYRFGGAGQGFGLSASVLHMLPRIGRVTPYLAAGAGLAQCRAPIISHDGLVIGTQPKIAFEVNAGGGVKVPVNDTWGMRTDARWFKSFGRNGSEHWSVTQGISFDAARR
jgi:hypothetical protein